MNSITNQYVVVPTGIQMTLKDGNSERFLAATNCNNIVLGKVKSSCKSADKHVEMFIKSRALSSRKRYGQWVDAWLLYLNRISFSF